MGAPKMQDVKMQNMTYKVYLIKYIWEDILKLFFIKFNEILTQ